MHKLRYWFVVLGTVAVTAACTVLPKKPMSAGFQSVLHDASAGMFVFKDEYDYRHETAGITKELAGDVQRAAVDDCGARPWASDGQSCSTLLMQNVNTSALLFMHAEAGDSASADKLGHLYAKMNHVCPETHDWMGFTETGYGTAVQEVYAEIHKAEAPAAAYIVREKAQQQAKMKARRQRQKEYAEQQKEARAARQRREKQEWKTERERAARQNAHHEQIQREAAACHQTKAYRLWSNAQRIDMDENAIASAKEMLGHEDQVEAASGVVNLSRRRYAGELQVGAENDLIHAKAAYAKLGGNVDLISSRGEDPCAHQDRAAYR